MIWIFYILRRFKKLWILRLLLIFFRFQVILTKHRRKLFNLFLFWFQFWSRNWFGYHLNLSKKSTVWNSKNILQLKTFDYLGYCKFRALLTTLFIHAIYIFTTAKYHTSLPICTPKHINGARHGAVLPI